MDHFLLARALRRFDGLFAFAVQKCHCSQSESHKFGTFEGWLTVRRTLRLPFSLNGTQNHCTATKVLVYSINDIYFCVDSSKRFDTLKRNAAPLETGSGKRCHITLDNDKGFVRPLNESG